MPPPPPPPPLPSPFSGPPPFRGFPASAAAAGPPPGGSFGGPLPAPLPPPLPFPTIPGGGLPSSPAAAAAAAAYPPPPLLPPHLPPWPPPPPPPPPPPERPLPQWLGRERAGIPPLPPEAPARTPPGGGVGGAPRREEPAGGGGDPWLSRFLARHHRGPPPPPPPPPPSGPAGFGPGQAARVAAEALRLVARLSAQCGAWRERGGGVAAAAAAAESEALLAELRQVTRPLRSEGPGSGGGTTTTGSSTSTSTSTSIIRSSRPGPLVLLRRRLHKSRQKRLRRRQRRQEAREARGAAAAAAAEREAQIERWRARRAQEVEDRRREEELKTAADSVLSEVRKKQADTKRMTEILRGLEKLRKLRKEAAGRKGVCPPPAADEAFENEVQAFKTLIKKRTELYEAEERALRVMLEGEQEEERKRDMEKKEKKEKEKLLQQKREIDSKLFGDADEFPFTHILEPFTQYYLQAEYSVSSLIQIRHEWDRYLVPADHPEGHFIPPGWVLPCPPSNDIWATAVR